MFIFSNGFTVRRLARRIAVQTTLCGNSSNANPGLYPPHIPTLVDSNLGDEVPRHEAAIDALYGNLLCESPLEDVRIAGLLRCRNLGSVAITQHCLQCAAAALVPRASCDGTPSRRLVTFRFALLGFWTLNVNPRGCGIQQALKSHRQAGLLDGQAAIIHPPHQDGDAPPPCGVSGRLPQVSQSSRASGAFETR
ncbi:hypothetical protein TgHK011_005414 [Trichoderma gracile]|nr:hypothetical protein TgHK011_005414 [Trichoderma gracile]